jgi:threonine aldolase
MSKMRFLSAQLNAYLKHGLWLDNARHANAMAEKLAQGLKAVEGARLMHPVQANELFVELPEETTRALETQGFGFYRWPLNTARSGITVRLVTSFATSSADVDEFIAAATSVKPKG